MCRQCSPGPHRFYTPPELHTRWPPMPRTITSSCRFRPTTPSAPLPCQTAAPQRKSTVSLDASRSTGTPTRTPGTPTTRSISLRSVSRPYWPRHSFHWRANCRALSDPPLFLDARIGLDNLAGAKLLGFEDHLGFRIAELLEIVALDVLELHLQHPRLRPFAVLAEGDFADDRVERMAAEVIGEPGLVEALRALDRLTQDLQVGVGEGRQIPA